MTKSDPAIVVSDLTMAYGDFVIMHDLNFTVNQGDIFVIMGGSGCGKSTLLKHMIGLKKPTAGNIFYGTKNLWEGSETEMKAMLRGFGILYQSGALWSSMTLEENVALPLQQYTSLTSREVKSQVALKLSLVGLAGFESYYPAEISGGMRKRAGLARALALDPKLLFFDEPSAGLDPVSARRLDDLIMQLCRNLNTTVVVVTHELASIFAIGSNSVFLDAESRTMIATGNPRILLEECNDLRVQRFLRRGELEESQLQPGEVTPSS